MKIGNFILTPIIVCRYCKNTSNTGCIEKVSTDTYHCHACNANLINEPFTVSFSQIKDISRMEILQNYNKHKEEIKAFLKRVNA